jgi:membrane protein implicated in regulation of membrane protease activity
MPMDPVSQDEIIKSFEFAFLLVFSIGLMSTTNFIVMNYPLAGLMLILVSALLLLLAKAVRRRKNIAKIEKDE